MTASTEYCKALFEITEELSTSDTVRDQISTVKTALCDAPDFVKLLDTPALSREERVSLIDKAFSDIDEHLSNLLKILAEKHSAYLIPKIADEYLTLYDQSRGIIQVSVISARPLSDGQKERLASKLEAETGKKICLTATVDPAVLGGMKIRYSGVQLDGTVKTRLDSFGDSLKSIVI